LSYGVCDYSPRGRYYFIPHHHWLQGHPVHLLQSDHPLCLFGCCRKEQVSVWDQFFAGFITGVVMACVAKIAQGLLKALLIFIGS
jgi:hypothetical protein